MRRLILMALTLAATLVGASSAQAMVVNDGGTYAGVALVPSARGNSLPSGVSAVTSTGPCTDPALTPDLWFSGQKDRLPDAGLCYHGGSVIHQNEMFALTWDPQRSYWSGTRGYVEQFLRDVADGSGTLTSPYADTAQYTDASGRAENTSIFGGGCIDYGAVGGSACDFGGQTAAGSDFPASGCTPTGDSFTSVVQVGTNSVCLTDAQLQGELSTIIGQTGLLSRTQPGYTPLVNLLLPPGVETCLDAGGTLCSANGSLTPPPPASLSTATTGGNLAAGAYGVQVTYVTATGETMPSASASVTTTGKTSSITIESPPPANGATGWYAYVTQPNGSSYTRQQTTPTAIGSPLTLTAVSSGGAVPPAHATFFCSYHSQVSVGGTEVAYVVQPWTAGTACDEPDASAIDAKVTPAQLAVDVGQRLVSPLSQAEMAAITNPGLNGWSALDGSEIDDNGGCGPIKGGDSVTVGGSSQNPYLLQREFNNAGLMENDPNTYLGCAPNVVLSAQFVAPSSVNPGDEVQFDGSPTASTLIVPNAGYVWDFGDGTTATGPSVVHTFNAGGTYTVKLTVTDRGGYTSTISEPIHVLGPTPPPTSPQPTKPKLQVRILLMPQSLHGVLEKGVTLRVTSNARANGIAYVSIPRSLAKRAHIRVGKRLSVVIGVGTLSRVTNGAVSLHLKLSHSVVAKLRRLRHLTLTVRLSLVGAGGTHLVIDAAGRY